MMKKKRKGRKNDLLPQLPQTKINKKQSQAWSNTLHGKFGGNFIDLNNIQTQDVFNGQIPSIRPKPG